MPQRIYRRFFVWRVLLHPGRLSVRICLEVMHQLRPAHLLEALQKSVVATVGKQETELFVEVLRVVDQSREVKQGDRDIVLRDNEKQVVEHSGEGGLLF